VTIGAAPGTRLESWPGMLIRDLMQRDVVTLRVTDTLGLADDIMELGRIRHLPVLAGDTVVGIVSQRDLYRAAVSSMLQMSRAAERDWLSTVPVRSVMSPTVSAITPDASVREAVELMLARRIGCLPVIEQGRLVGLVSETDCLRHLAQVLGISEEKGGLPELAQ
jgi:CBS domain-containing protein